MIDNAITQAAVGILRIAEIDGETMEWIIDELGMREQVSHQLQLMDVQRMIAALAPRTAEADAKTNTSISESDIETLADDIASRIASNADDYIDYSNIELSIDYERQVNVDSVGLEEGQIACTINDYLTNWLRSRNITITEE